MNRPVGTSRASRRGVSGHCPAGGTPDRPLYGLVSFSRGRCKLPRECNADKKVAIGGARAACALGAQARDMTAGVGSGRRSPRIAGSASITELATTCHATPAASTDLIPTTSETGPATAIPIGPTE